ncbi:MULTISPECIES: hypothetical protein [Listeria]|uniref:Uncharacterized protein n=2 Tax=Listeria TaxID=1637 RepID=A0A7X1CA78_9LIST|nr:MULTISPECIES: hypothetical protein [Listeria]MBC1481577.1 hypothetical protein [Listeria seeligeri]MBC1490113.1 hypothetical protein [Listeria immobilis]QPL19470.1 hypothetical protein pLIS600176c [Listeria ivanovii]UCK61602.1 hypothetical protein pLIS46_00161c [Listeria ivanovii]
MIEYKDLPDYAYGYTKKDQKTIIIMKDTGEVLPCKAEKIPPMLLNKEMNVSAGIMIIMMIGYEKGFSYVKRNMEEMNTIAEAVDMLSQWRL